MVGEISEVNRWETKCCGYTFNTKSKGIATSDEPLVAKIQGKGYRINKCMGCGKEYSSVKLITS